MVTVVVRVWMPDRPGALGQVASRIGAVRGDVLGIEILEQGAGRAIDELIVELPDADLVTLLAAEVDAVDGVSVEAIRDVDAERIDPSLAALAAAAAMAESPAAQRLAALCDGAARVVDAEWVVVLRGVEQLERFGEPPDLAWLHAFLSGVEHLDDVGKASPGELVWADLLASGLTVAAGRTDRPFHERERVRLSLLARIADAVVAGPVDAGDAR